MASTCTTSDCWLSSFDGDPLSTLRPFNNEIVAENVLRQQIKHVGAMFWSNFTEDLSSVDSLNALLVTLQQLDKFVRTSSGIPGSTLCQTGGVHLAVIYCVCGCDSASLPLSLQVPPFFSTLMENVYTEAMQCWTTLSGRNDSNGYEKESAYWSKLKKVTSLLNSLHLFNFITAFPLSSVVHKKIQEHITEQCSSNYDVAMIKDVANSVTEYLLNWLQHILVDNCESVLEEWKSQLMYSTYEIFAKLRISELFEIIVDYPESEPTLRDLAQCLDKVALKDHLIISLDRSFKNRLLHPGVNTADIITQYISAVKALRLVDPGGVVSEKVCGPVREYLYHRDDTVRCIVASLTTDCDSELAEALIKGESNVESDYDNHDFDSWEPQPVDSNPDSAETTRMSSDIISLLVNIYGSCEMFVSEYRNLLADRLLQMCSYNISREVCTLELLKHRFGENSLHFCEVMLKDVGDSKRIYSTISSQRANERHETNELELQGMILSSEFWPALREESFKLPAIIQRQIDMYSREYSRLKGMRKLEWKTYLGMVDIDILCGKRKLSLTVSPIKAILLFHFQTETQWSVESLSHILKAQPSVVRKHIGFWVAQGLLKELSTDEYGLVKEQRPVHKGYTSKIEYEDESAMETAHTMETEYQMYWNYITHMLTNLGPLTLQKIHSMLGMFGLQGNLKQTLGLNDLKMYLQKKTVEQQLVLNNGSYSLVD